MSPEKFRSLAQEIREIASLSGKLWETDNSFQDRIRRIHGEMDQLENLLAQRTFEHLPLEKRQELHKSLLVSRDELIKSLQAAPCPTDRIQ